MSSIPKESNALMYSKSGVNKFGIIFKRKNFASSDKSTYSLWSGEEK